MSVPRLAVVMFVVSSAWGSGARADEAAVDDGAPGPITARPAANDDSITPGVEPSEAHGAGVITSTVTYSGASEDTTIDVHGEIHVWGPFRLVVRVDDVFDAARPGIGGAVQWLDERKHGVSSSAYFSYKTEGFTEPEGELEALVSFGKQLGAVHGTFNLAYGQDPEGNERDGELALALHVEPAPGLFAGVLGRYRDALGSDGDKGTGILRDVVGEGTATYVIDRFAVTGAAGIAGVEVLDAGGMKTGAIGSLSVGAVF